MNFVLDLIASTIGHLQDKKTKKRKKKRKQQNKKASFYYEYRNSPGFFVLVQMRVSFTKFKYERKKKELNSGLSSKKTPSCISPIT